MRRRIGKNLVQINISEFKAKALRLFAETSKTGKEYLILKKGVPVARVVPVQVSTGSRRGSLKGLANIHGDIVHFNSAEDWEALEK